GSSMASGRRSTQISHMRLPPTDALARPSTQASAEPVRALARCAQDDATPFTAHQDFALGSEPALLWKPDRLTAAVLEELRTSSFHGVSLDLCLYMVKWPLPALVRTWACATSTILPASGVLRCRGVP